MSYAPQPAFPPALLAVAGVELRELLQVSSGSGGVPVRIAGPVPAAGRSSAAGPVLRYPDLLSAVRTAQFLAQTPAGRYWQIGVHVLSQQPAYDAQIALGLAQVADSGGLAMASEVAQRFPPGMLPATQSLGLRQLPGIEMPIDVVGFTFPRATAAELLGQESGQESPLVPAPEDDIDWVRWSRTMTGVGIAVGLLVVIGLVVWGAWSLLSSASSGEPASDLYATADAQAATPTAVRATPRSQRRLAAATPRPTPTAAPQPVGRLAQGIPPDILVDPAAEFRATVDRAIQRGTAYLWSRQDPTDKRWPSYRGHGEALTYMAAYTLMTLGVSPGDERLRDAVAAAIRADASRDLPTYELSLRVLAQSPSQTTQTRRRIATDIRALVDKQLALGLGASGWDYGREGRSDVPDSSNTQFAILALDEARRYSHQVPLVPLARSSQYWMETQAEDGGFRYRPRPNIDVDVYLSMTAAGLASLVLADDAAGIRRGVSGPRPELPAVTQSLAWLDAYFAGQPNYANMCNNIWNASYGWYAVERAAAATGRRRFGGKDWFREGVYHLVEHQSAEGVFSPPAGGADPIVDTCFGLLFLAKATRPIAYAKLIWDGDWNNTPKDVRRLTRWLTEKRELLVGFELVAADSDLLDDDLAHTPILYWTGTRPLVLPLTAELALQRYVRQGGTLLAVADTRMTPDMVQAAQTPTPAPQVAPGEPTPRPRTSSRLYVTADGRILSEAPRATPGPAATASPASRSSPSPQPRARRERGRGGSLVLDGPGVGAEPGVVDWGAASAQPADTPMANSTRDLLDRLLKPLGFTRQPVPADHPLWTIIYKLPPIPGAEGWTDGHTWRAFLIPAALGTAWDGYDTADDAGSFQLANNLLALTTEDLGFRRRIPPPNPAFVVQAPLPDQPFRLLPDYGDPPELAIGLARHQGNFNLADLAIPRLTAELILQRRLAAAYQLGVPVRPETLATLDMLVVAGDNNPGWNSTEYEYIRDFCRKGGFVTFSPIGNSPAFLTAVEQGVRLAFGSFALQPIAGDHPLLTGKFDNLEGPRIERLRQRRQFVGTGSTGRPDAELTGIYLDNQLVGVISNADLMYGLARVPAASVGGLQAEVATALAQNLAIAARLQPKERE